MDETLKSYETSNQSKEVFASAFEYQDNLSIEGREPVESNVFRVLEDFYNKATTDGYATERAKSDAATFIDAAGSYSVKWGDLTGSLRDYMTAIGQSGSIKRIAVSRKKELVFLDKRDRELIRIDLHLILRNALKEKFIQQRVAHSENVISQNINDELSYPVDIPEIPYGKSRLGANGISVMPGISQPGKGPEFIYPTTKSLCSYYAYKVMADYYGKKAVDKLRGIKNKYPSAWEVKHFFKNNVKINLSLTKNFERDKNGKPLLHLKNREAYEQGIRSIFKLADSKKTPAFLTFYLRTSSYKEKVWAFNENLPQQEQTYASHIGVILGRQPIQSASVTQNTQLYEFAEEKMVESSYKLKGKYYGLLNIVIQKTDGSEIHINADNTIEKIDANGTKTVLEYMPQEIPLEMGDIVSWQDVLFTDFIGGNGQVKGLAALLSSTNWKPQDYITLKGLKQRTDFDYKPNGFFHVKSKKGPIKNQIMKALSISEKDLEYYLVALEDLGINLNKITPIQPLPKFDMNALKEVIENKGGINAIRANIRKDYLDKYASNHPEAEMIMIEANKSLWWHIKRLFEPKFQGRNRLSKSDREAILEIVDTILPNIRLKPKVPLRRVIEFQLGDFIYLPKDRINAIIKFIKNKQTTEFGHDDYIEIVKKGFNAEEFISKCVGNVLTGTTYSELNANERNYLLEQFKKDNPKIDIKKIQIGSRVILKKKSLIEALQNFHAKKELLKPNSDFKSLSTLFMSGTRLVVDNIKIPSSVKRDIEKIYSGKTVDDAVIRACLYIIYAQENLRGKWRGFKKDMALSYLPERKFLSWGDRLVNSVGIFQSRPTYKDLKNCQKLFESYNITLPGSADKLRDYLINHPQKELIATIVAGERLRESLQSFRRFLKANGEKQSTILDRNFALMVITNYNRSENAIYRAVFQNWSYNLAEAAGVKSDVELKDVDGSLRKNGSASKEVMYNMGIYSTITRVAKHLIESGEIKFKGDVDGSLGLILVSRRRFVRSRLFKKIKRWYKKKTGKTLQFSFTDQEIMRGDNIFSYGRGFLEVGLGEFDKKAGARLDNWPRLFKDLEQLKNLSEQF